MKNATCKTFERTADGARALELQTRPTITPYRAVQSAIQNADDTMMELGHRNWSGAENAVELEAMWAGFFWGTLESVLTWPETSNITRSWFARRGIEG